MKYILILLTALATSAQAKLGWTLEEARNNYGPEVKVEKAWCGGTAYSFINDGLYIYAIIPTGESKIADVSYFHNKIVWGLSNEQCEGLWLFNQNGGRWDSGSDKDWLNKNLRKTYEKLGKENFKHIMQYSRDAKYGNVGNRKETGYQVRTVKQFYAEQKVIKKLMAAEKGKKNGKV